MANIDEIRDEHEKTDNPIVWGNRLVDNEYMAPGGAAMEPETMADLGAEAWSVPNPRDFARMYKSKFIRVVKELYNVTEF
ncbi:MAG: hypothetical protein J6X53_09610 [Abditibacteriota bacterium]|nr:hypothetical protein [Abditibacteriota bacterium]